MTKNLSLSLKQAAGVRPPLDLFQELTNMKGEEMATVISDFLADLMHLCRVEDIDFEEAVAVAVVNFEAEIKEGDPDVG